MVYYLFEGNSGHFCFVIDAFSEVSQEATPRVPTKLLEQKVKTGELAQRGIWKSDSKMECPQLTRQRFLET